MEKPEPTPALTAAELAVASPPAGHSVALDHLCCQPKVAHGQLPPPLATGQLVALPHAPSHTSPRAALPFSRLCQELGEGPPRAHRLPGAPTFTHGSPHQHQLLLPASSTPAWGRPMPGRAGSAAAVGITGSLLWTDRWSRQPLLLQLQCLAQAPLRWGLAPGGGGWMLLKHRRALEATAAPWKSLLLAITLFCFLPVSIYKRCSNSWHRRDIKMATLKENCFAPEPGRWGQRAIPKSSASSWDKCKPLGGGWQPRDTPALPALSCTPEEGAEPATLRRPVPGIPATALRLLPASRFLNKDADPTVVVAVSGGGKRVG